MFTLTVAVVIIATIAIYTTWRTHKREQDTANRLAGDTKRAGRHRAKNRPTMTWRG